MAHESASRTLIEIAGGALRPASFADATLVIIDAQNEYVTGKLPLHNVGDAIAETARLLAAARAAGAPVLHVVQHSAPGRPLFAPDSPMADIVLELAPAEGEPIIVKRLPSAFSGTELAARLEAIARSTGRKAVILAGFMTHMCVSSTARAALDLGIPVTIVARATATRALPGPYTGVVSAPIVQEAALAELADRFAAIVPDTAAIERLAQPASRSRRVS